MDTIWHALSDGAPFSFINVAVLAVVLGIVTERFVFILTKYRVDAGEFMVQIKKLVLNNKFDLAIKLCDAAPVPLLQVLKAGLTQSQRGEDIASAAMEERMSEVIPELEKRIGTLWSLANIATLIGLLGTISGLIKSFAAVAFATPDQKSALLSKGISEAMWNTALGLGIAVTCMFFHLILHGMSKSKKSDLEKAVMKLENLITFRGRQE
jgi:biopolymer transport protein ExbB/TolQ